MKALGPNLSNQIKRIVRQDRALTVSVGLSLFLHAAFLVVALLWHLPGAKDWTEKTKRFFDVRSAESGPLQPGRGDAVRGYQAKMGFQNPTAPARTRETIDPKFESPKPKDRFTEKPKINRAEKKVASEVRENLLERLWAPSARKIMTASENARGVMTAGGSASQTQEIEIPEDFTDEMFAFTPKNWDESKARNAGLEAVRGGQGMLGQGGGYGSIDDMIQMRLETWKDPKDGQGYFRLSIAPASKASQLPVLPKEILFLVDSSLSIKDRRLEKFSKGIQYAVQNLNPDDRFNVYVFKDKSKVLASKSVPSEPKTIKAAVKFLNQVEPSEQTDIYEAFLKTIQKPSVMTPSYVILFSDGRPTKGETSSAQLIGEISRINARSRSIFAFSGGSKINRYLLDFLAYQNRGWSEYAPKSHLIDDSIHELYDKIRNPILTRVKYQMSGLENREAYPKHLPDFYLNTEFIVYGQFKDEDRFSMRVLGESLGEVKEMIFPISFKDAVPGDAEIARSWAFNKFYHLVSRMTMEGPDEKTEAEIQALTARFKIKSPYRLN